MFVTTQRAAMLGLASRLLVGALLLALMGLGCTSRSDPATQDATSPRICDERGGPADRDLLLCRIVRASERGQFPRRATEADIGRLLDEVEAFEQLADARRRGEVSPDAVREEFRELDQLCLELTGLTYEQIFLLPME